MDDNYISFNGMKIEDHALFEITKKCNYMCKHCFTFGGPSKMPNELSTEEIIGLVGQFSEFGFKDITFSGGDPATRRDLIDIVKETRREGITPHVFSTLITEDLLNELKKYVGVFALSLDGPKEIHDEIRVHNGAYEDSVRLLNLLKENHLNYFVQSMITPKSIQYMDWLIDTCIEYGVKGLRLSHVSPQGRNLLHQELYLTVEQIDALWAKARERKDGKSLTMFTNLVEKDYFLNNRDIYTALIPHVLPNGDFVPMLGAGSKHSIGNLREASLEDIINTKTSNLAVFMNILEDTYAQCDKVVESGWNRDWIPFEDVLALNLLGKKLGQKDGLLMSSFVSKFMSNN